MAVAVNPQHSINFTGATDVRPAAGREPLDADARSADSRTHRATRGASDVIELPAQSGEQGRRPAANSVPAGVVPGGRPSADAGSAAPTPRERGVSLMRMRGKGGEDVTSSLAPSRPRKQMDPYRKSRVGHGDAVDDGSPEHACYRAHRGNPSPEGPGSERLSRAMILGSCANYSTP